MSLRQKFHSATYVFIYPQLGRRGSWLIDLHDIGWVCYLNESSLHISHSQLIDSGLQAKKCQCLKCQISTLFHWSKFAAELLSNLNPGSSCQQQTWVKRTPWWPEGVSCCWNTVSQRDGMWVPWILTHTPTRSSSHSDLQANELKKKCHPTLSQQIRLEFVHPQQLRCGPRIPVTFVRSDFITDMQENPAVPKQTILLTSESGSTLLGLAWTIHRYLWIRLKSSYHQVQPSLASHIPLVWGWKLYSCVLLLDHDGLAC